MKRGRSQAILAVCHDWPQSKSTSGPKRAGRVAAVISCAKEMRSQVLLWAGGLKMEFGEPPPPRSKEALDKLVAAARAGSSDALDRLIEALSECLWAEFANRRKLQHLSPSRGPSDLVQDTLVRVRLNFGDFTEESFGAFRRWARGIFFNCSREVGRNSRCRNAPQRRESIWRALRQRIGFNPDGSRPEEALERQEDAARAYQLFDGLKVDERTMIALLWSAATLATKDRSSLSSLTGRRCR